MTGRRKALVALYGTAGVLATPWAIEWLLVRLGRRTWRPPAVPGIRFTTGRNHA